MRHRSMVKFLVLLFSFSLMVYPFMLRLGVSGGSIKGGVEVYATPSNDPADKYEWVDHTDPVYKLGRNLTVFLYNVDLSGLIFVANESVGQHIPLDEGRFFKGENEMVIGRTIFHDLQYAGYKVALGSTLKLNLQIEIENTTTTKNFEFRITGIIPTALGEYGKSIILPYSLFVGENLTGDLLLWKYIVVPEKGIPISAIRDTLRSNDYYLAEPSRLVDVDMFQFYITFLEVFSFIAGFIFVLLLRESENTQFFKEYSILHMAGSDTGRFLRSVVLRELFIIIPAYLTATGLLSLLLPYIYRYLNNIFNYLIFTVSYSLTGLLVTLAVIPAILLYDFLILRFHISRFSPVKFMREVWEI